MKAMRIALAIGVLGAVACALAAAMLGVKPVLEAYLAAFLLWLGLPLGAMAVLMIHHLTGGRWGTAIRPMLESAALTAPLAVLFVLPVLIGVRVLYPWTDLYNDSPTAAYLNLPFFTARAAAFVLLWSVMAVLLVRWTRRADADPQRRDPWLAHCRRLSAAGLILYVLSASFALIDWGMSLDEHWYSTIYGVLFVTNHGLMAIAVSIVTASGSLSPWERAGVRGVLAERVQVESSTPSSGDPLTLTLSQGERGFAPDIFHDLGNWLLVFVVFWAYVSFSQYLIIWSGNIPEEVTWYVPRTRGVWGVVALALIVLHFAIPFVLLLNRPVKRRGGVLAWVAILVLVMQVINAWWMLVPSFNRVGSALHWIDPLAMAGVGGLWLAAYLWLLARAPTPAAHVAAEVAHA